MARTDYRDFRLEIGAGVGLHAIQHAKANPDTLLVAIEKTSEKFAKFKGRLKRHPKLIEQRNLLAVHGDARSWCLHELGHYSWSHVFLLYPNPNPKNPKARWINEPFFGELIARCAPHAIIELATNIESYAQEFKAVAQNRWGLSVKLMQTLHLSSHPEDFRPRTLFEKKYFERGESLYLLQCSQ